ncbi:MAG: alpha/beta hydrolase [Bacilli bacterium]|nr:alpha/beta hydrolase [Bacilli bacterium]
MKINPLIIFFLDKLMTKSEKPFLDSFEKPDNPLFSFDVPYVENPKERQHFDLYRADPERRRNVLLIDIHGGGYIHGWRRNNYPFAQVFRDEGYDVICGDYRFVKKKDKTDIRTEVEDLVAMLNCIKAKEEELGLKDRAWALTGDSAGGHFALLLGEILCDEELKKTWGVDANLSKPKAVLINCPAYDFKIMTEGRFTRGGLRRMFGDIVFDKELFDKLDPKKNLPSLQCPLFFTSCRNDGLKENYFSLEADCEKLGIEHEKLFLESEDKKVGHVHNVIDVSLPESKQVNQAMLDFLGKKA